MKPVPVLLSFSKTELAWHRVTAVRLLRIMPKWVLLIPFVAMLCLYELDQFALLSPYIAKKRAEIYGPVIVFFALSFATYLAWKKPATYYTWQAFFAAAVFLRELHFWGTNTGFLLAFPALIWWASRHRERLEPFISDKAIATLMTSVIWTYLVSQIFDWFMCDVVLNKPLADVFEENLEALGHLLFLLQVAVSSCKRRAHDAG